MTKAEAAFLHIMWHTSKVQISQRARYIKSRALKFSQIGIWRPIFNVSTQDKNCFCHFYTKIYFFNDVTFSKFTWSRFNNNSNTWELISIANKPYCLLAFSSYRIIPDCLNISCHHNGINQVDACVHFFFFVWFLNPIRVYIFLLPCVLSRSNVFY